MLNQLLKVNQEEAESRRNKNVKKYIKEEVIKDSLFDVEAEMLSLKESIILQMISEGVDDPGILKCVFMEEPGSGKSCKPIFGIDKKLQSSFSGLKSVN